MKTANKLWIAIAILTLLSPLGLILPEYFKAGAAWGEWGIETVKELTGYVPAGLEKLSRLWNAPLPDYAFNGWDEKGLAHLSFAYIISAIIGIAIVVAVVSYLGKWLAKKGD